jgi:hypothetical protein
MATSTLIQYLETTAVTGLGVSVGVGAASMNRRQTETFIAKENLLVGDFVAFDLAATADGDVSIGVFKADGNSAPVRTPFGVVLGSAETSGKLPLVQESMSAFQAFAMPSLAITVVLVMLLGAVLQITNTAGSC